MIGEVIPPEQIDKYLLPIILGIIILSIIPFVIYLIQDNRSNSNNQDKK